LKRSETPAAEESIPRFKAYYCYFPRFLLFRALSLLCCWVGLIDWLIGWLLGGGLLRCVGREYRSRMKAPRHSVVGRVWHGEGEERSAGVSCASFGCGNRDTQQQQQQRIATGAVDGSVRVWLVNATGTTSETNLLVGAGGTRK